VAENNNGTGESEAYKHTVCKLLVHDISYCKLPMLGLEPAIFVVMNTVL